MTSTQSSLSKITDILRKDIVDIVAWATQEHQDAYAYEGRHPRYHCGGSDCGRDIGRRVLATLEAKATEETTE